ncbi:MAG TPA: hypothetical protein VG900_12775 [Hyphomicrobiaceae bacterium]|nr:hypothetical protein [Hyphomicrobiaceae bacterium]
MQYRRLAIDDAPIYRDDCFFYHTMDLPEHGVIEGEWDLRGCEDAYLGPVELSGKTVFDVGPASGYLSFEMTRRGAKVVALEWDENAESEFGLVPYWDYAARFGRSREQMVSERKRHIVSLRKSFLLAQRALGITIPIYTGDAVASAPPMPADIALLGCILLHLRDPVGAIYNIASRVREAVVITELACGPPVTLDGPPALIFWPSAEVPGNSGTWWSFSPAALRQILLIAGFSRFALTPGSAFSNQANARIGIFNLTAWR